MTRLEPVPGREAADILTLHESVSRLERHRTEGRVQEIIEITILALRLLDEELRRLR